MNRDHALYALMGIVIGFVAAYPVFEVMSARQPSLRVPGQSDQVPAGVAPADEGGAPAGGGPAMEEVQRLRKIVDANPNDADAVLALARLNLSINDLIRARGLYERYVKLRPEDREGRLTLANLHFDTRQFDKARDLYQEFLIQEPGHPEVLTDLGTCYRNLGDPARALELFRKAQGMNPDLPQAVFNEVVVLAMDLKDFASASERFEKLKQLEPANPNVEALGREIERLRAQ